jgi:hypothetical protein
VPDKTTWVTLHQCQDLVVKQSSKTNEVLINVPGADYLHCSITGNKLEVDSYICEEN